MQLAEILIIAGLVIWQLVVFFRNRTLIARVAAMYPGAGILNIEQATIDSIEESTAPFSWEAIKDGAWSFTDKNRPGSFYIDGTVDKNDVPSFSIKQWNEENEEWEVWATIPRVALQAKFKAGDLGPSDAFEVVGEAEIDRLAEIAGASDEFQQIRTDTNEYLLNNKGAAADFNILKDISERHAEALDEEIQSQVSMPLYLGLLGTFLGAMFGLASLLLGGESTPTPGTDATFIGNDQILAFLGGIGIAMVGSFIGLGLTLWANQLLKTARARRDKLKNAYYTFLQVNLLPKLNSDMQKSMGDMKAVLDTFNEKFFTRIQDDFFAKLSQILPMMDKMGDNITKTSENITVQRDFLVKLEEVGVTKMANATIKIFDKVEQSAATFEKFMGYQAALNHTVQMGTEATRTMAAMLNRLELLEKAATQDLPKFINEHGLALRQMAHFFQTHQQTIDDVRAGLESSLDEGARSLKSIVDHRVTELNKELQQADDNLRQYFASLNDQNIYDKVVRYLQPFSALPDEQRKLTTEQTSQNKTLTNVLNSLEKRLLADEQIQRELQAQVERLARIQADLAQPSFFGKLVGQKPKDYFGANGSSR